MEGVAARPQGFISPLLSNVWVQRGTRCPCHALMGHITVAKGMNGRNGILMTSFPEGCVGLWQGGKASKVKGLWTSDDQEVYRKWPYSRAQRFRVYRAFSDSSLGGRDD